MITFTKDQLIASAHARIEFAEMMLSGELEPLKERTWSIELELARIALASLEAEPYGYVHKAAYEQAGSCGLSSDHEAYRDSSTHIAVYTAPPAPVSVPEEMDIMTCHLDGVTETYAEGWNACRGAMLQGADGNSPVVPDGWVAVPKEPTPDMREAYHQAQAEYEDSDGLWSPDHQWQAMLAAAPQQEAQ